MPTTTATPATERRRRADVLLARYATLTATNPGFDYSIHMRGYEPDRDDAHSVTAALLVGESGRSDLEPLLADDATFHLWRLRLDHPHWWIGGLANTRTPLLHQLHSDLTGSDTFNIGIPATGYPGAHWFTRAQDTIGPLSQPARTELARTVAHELTGRSLCLNGVYDDTDPLDLFTAFLERADRPGIREIDELETVLHIVAVTHGTDWEHAFRIMMTELDPITWSGLIRALEVEVAHLAGREETAP